MGGGVILYELRTHEVQIILNTLGIIDIDESIRPDYYWIKDWTACVKKLNYKADVAFFGNSITANSDFQYYFKDIHVVEFGHCGDRVDGLIRRISLLQSVSPKKVFVMAGINDLHRSSPGTIINRYDKLLTLMKDSLPNAKIYVQSILPVNHSMERRYASNTTIQETNELIKKLAMNHHCQYIDLYSSYVENGLLPDSLSYDGVHLCKNAYDRWAKVIKPYIYE